jgi:hypothetical protein
MPPRTPAHALGFHRTASSATPGKFVSNCLVDVSLSAVSTHLRRYPSDNQNSPIPLKRHCRLAAGGFSPLANDARHTRLLAKSASHSLSCVRRWRTAFGIHLSFPLRTAAPRVRFPFRRRAPPAYRLRSRWECCPPDRRRQRDSRPVR